MSQSISNAKDPSSNNNDVVYTPSTHGRFGILISTGTIEGRLRLLKGEKKVLKDVYDNRESIQLDISSMMKMIDMVLRRRSWTQSLTLVQRTNGIFMIS